MILATDKNSRMISRYSCAIVCFICQYSEPWNNFCLNDSSVLGNWLYPASTSSTPVMAVIVLWMHFSNDDCTLIRSERFCKFLQKNSIRYLNLASFLVIFFTGSWHFHEAVYIPHHLSTSLTLPTQKHPKGSQRGTLWSLINPKVSSFQTHSSLKILCNFVCSLILQIFIKSKAMCRKKEN